MLVYGLLQHVGTHLAGKGQQSIQGSIFIFGRRTHVDVRTTGLDLAPIECSPALGQWTLTPDGPDKSYNRL